jgi:hypothetical protein
MPALSERLFKLGTQPLYGSDQGVEDGRPVVDAPFGEGRSERFPGKGNDCSVFIAVAKPHPVEKIDTQIRLQRFEKVD